MKNPHAPADAPLLPLELWAPGAELLRTAPAALRAALAAAGPVRGRAARLIEQRVGFLNREQQQLVAAPAASCLARDELLAADRPQVFVAALIPDCTLELHPWLAELGDASLGATLLTAGGLEAGPFEFAALPASHALAARARAGVAAPTLWARRAWYALRGRRLLLQEVFLPEPERC